MNRLSDEWFTSKSEKVPLWHKIALSIDETYVYTGIGRETIRELTKQPEAKQFTLKIGKRTLIKRKQFEEYKILSGRCRRIYGGSRRRKRKARCSIYGPAESRQ